MIIISKAILDVSEQLKKDPMADILGFFDRENDRAREHELRLFSMIPNGNQPQQSQIPQPLHHTHFDPRRHTAQGFSGQQNYSKMIKTLHTPRKMIYMSCEHLKHV